MREEGEEGTPFLLQLLDGKKKKAAATDSPNSPFSPFHLIKVSPPKRASLPHNLQRRATGLN